MQGAIGGLSAWEVDSWIGPLNDDAPKWLKDAKARHAAAIDSYQKAVSYTVHVCAQIEAEQRAHRRAIQEAVLAGRQPPSREQSARTTR